MAGGSSGKSSDGKKKARIEIIPLIDVVFFLLATFVLFTLSLAHLQDIPVVLPQATTSNQPPDPDMVRLQISDDGSAFWNKEPIDPKEIRDRLGELKGRLANPRVLIAGDNKAHFGPVVRALDEVRKAGIDQVSVETRVTETGR